MRNLKEEKFKKLYEISLEIGELEKGDFKKLEKQNETLKTFINKYAAYDSKNIKEYYNKKIKLVCGFTESFGRYKNYKKYYEQLEIVEKIIKI